MLVEPLKEGAANRPRPKRRFVFKTILKEGLEYLANYRRSARDQKHPKSKFHFKMGLISGLSLPGVKTAVMQVLCS